MELSLCGVSLRAANRIGGIAAFEQRHKPRIAFHDNVFGPRLRIAQHGSMHDLFADALLAPQQQRLAGPKLFALP